MNLLTEEEGNLEIMEKDSLAVRNKRYQDIQEVDNNIKLLAKTLVKAKDKLQYYTSILQSTGNEHSKSSENLKLGGMDKRATNASMTQVKVPN